MKLILYLALYPFFIFPPVDEIKTVVSGIYMSPKDYSSGKLSLGVDCKNEKHKIKLHDLFEKPYIDVVHDGKNFRYKKSEIFGFKDCDGIDYRFFNEKEFQILENKYITLYQTVGLKSNPSGRGVVTATDYFFSIGPESDIIPLTLFNLKVAFKDNHPFHDELIVNFQSDEDLIEYDSFHKMYSINHILEKYK